jgi:hypothetical protein
LDAAEQVVKKTAITITKDVQMRVINVFGSFKVAKIKP